MKKYLLLAALVSASETFKVKALLTELFSQPPQRLCEMLHQSQQLVLLIRPAAEMHGEKVKHTNR